jgi:transposase
VIPKGVAALRQALPSILEDAENGLPLAMRESLHLAWQQWRFLAESLAHCERILTQRVRSLEPCQRLTQLAGVGDKNAIGLYVRIGAGDQFKNGREAAACTGLTPKQSSSGGKVRIGSIGKFRGNQRLRSSLILGARAMVNALQKRPATNATEQWLKQLIVRRGPGRAAVALANKNVRTAWAMLRYNRAYEEQPITI